MRKKLLLLFLTGIICMLESQALGQQRTITGRVTDESGEPQVGATVFIPGTSIGTTTGLDGTYSLRVTGDAKILVAKYLGMIDSEKPIVGNVVNFELKEDARSLDEVVVIGYGTVSKRDLTGSVVSMDAKALANIPVSSTMEAMTGRMAGVSVTTTEGSPDADIKIRVRGGGSITQDNSPLYVVDGFTVSSISAIAPGDIESIVVLKDASATAIYGAQGANGVVLITTKTDAEGRVTVNFNTYMGIKNVYNLTEVLSPYEYVYYQRELDPSTSATSPFSSYYGRWEDIGIYQSREGTDWQNQLYGNTGFQQNYNLSLSGGTRDVRFRLSFTRDDEDYIMLNSAKVRNNIDLRINGNVSKAISMDFTVRLSDEQISGPSISSGRKLRDGVKYAPVLSLTSLDQSIIEGEDDTSVEALSTLNNPLFDIQNEYKEQHRFNNTYHAGVTWKIMKGLSFRTQGSYSYIKNYTDNIWLKDTGEAKRYGGQPVARRTDQKGNSWNVINRLNYDLKLKDHSFKFMAGQEMKSSATNQTVMESKFFPADMTAKDVLAQWNLGEPQPTYTTVGEPRRSFSFFGRLDYSFKDRYLLTLTAREDAVNVFAPGNRWGFFPAAAFAWRVIDEPFLKDKADWISNLKWRISYGAVGNANVGSYWRKEFSYETAANKQYYPGESIASSMKLSGTLYNDQLTWETKISFNTGIDFGFFRDRLSGTIDFYKDITKDLIMGVPLPINSGYGSQYQNVGQTSNRGIELTLNGYIIDRKDFQLSANFNIAFNRNKIDKFVSADGNSSLYSSGWGMTTSTYDYLAQEGQPIGLMYGYVTDGMYSFDDFTFNTTTKKWDIKSHDSNGDPIANTSQLIASSGSYFAPGHIKLKDLDGDGVITEADRTVIGRAQPKHTGGFGLNMMWKGFDVSALFNWSYGNDIYNANKIDYTTYSGSRKYNNVSTNMSLANRFTTVDPATGYNIVYGEHANPELLQELNTNAKLWSPIINSTFLHSWAIEDGSFLRLSSLTLGYTLPNRITRKFYVQNLRTYVSAYNLYTWTNYSGQDPEVDTRRSTPLTPGVDYSAYPKARTFVFGLNLTF